MAVFQPYFADVEVPPAYEAQSVRDILAIMGATQRENVGHHRHARRDAQAKSHVIMKASVRLNDQLPSELAQVVPQPALARATRVSSSFLSALARSNQSNLRRRNGSNRATSH